MCRLIQTQPQTAQGEKLHLRSAGAELKQWKSCCPEGNTPSEKAAVINVVCAELVCEAVITAAEEPRDRRDLHVRSLTGEKSGSECFPFPREPALVESSFRRGSEADSEAPLSLDTRSPGSCPSRGQVSVLSLLLHVSHSGRLWVCF